MFAKRPRGGVDNPFVCFRLLLGRTYGIAKRLHTSSYKLKTKLSVWIQFSLLVALAPKEEEWLPELYRFVDFHLRGKTRPRITDSLPK